MVRVTVEETFFSIEVRDMQRAIAFYTSALSASVVFASPRWSSLRIAGVRLGLALNEEREDARVGLHFAVTDFTTARVAVERAGGFSASPIEVAPGVVVVAVTDTEGNTFALTRADS
jgi:predicted enzyme related to lactoylglutathione lyase